MSECKAAFGQLQGKTLRAVRVNDDEYRNRIEFECDDGSIFMLYHEQACCESVYIESIVGDISDLIGVPILLAEEAKSSDTPNDVRLKDQPDSQTWTFYKLRTIKGSVDIRWHGTSNGCYSESVDFVRMEAQD